MGIIISMSKKMDLGIRPKCSVDGCNNDCQVVGKRKDGTRTFRKVCQQHHVEYCASNRGMTVTEWTNSFHPYRDRRKDYCENIDGRLGFICTTNVVWTGMLDVDHIDGDSSNNADENLQTLCRCCHAFKTNVNEDYKTPGRKALGIKY